MSCASCTARAMPPSKPCEASRSSSRGGRSRRSWGHRARGSRPSCTAWPDSTRPTSGSVWIGDVDLTTLSEKLLTALRRDKVGFVFQAFNLVPTLTASENITLPLDIAGRDVDGAWYDQVVDTDRAARPARSSTQRALGRPAAARRRCPCAREPARDRLRGRADRQPRLALGRGAPGILPRGGHDLRSDDRHGHARRERGELRRPGRVPRPMGTWSTRCGSRPPRGSSTS